MESLIIHVETAGGGNQADVLKSIFGDLNCLVEVVASSSVYRVLEDNAHNGARSPVSHFAQGHLCVALKAKSAQAPIDLSHKFILLARQHATAARQKFVHIRLLTYGSKTLMHPQLTLPDPDLHRRAALLVPCAEVWANYQHPILSATLGELVENMVGEPWGEFYAQGKALLDSSLQVP